MAYNLLPWAIAALVAGTAANVKAKHDRESAAEDAFRDYARRADARTAETTQIWEKSLREQDAGNQMQLVGQLAQDKLDRVDALRESEVDNFDPILAGQARAPAVVQTEISRNLADEIAKARATIKANATLEGFSGRTFDRGLQLSRAATDLGNLRIFGQGDRNIYDYDMLKAEHAGENWGTLGDALTAVGSIMLMGGGSLTVPQAAASAGGVGLTSRSPHRATLGGPL